MKPIIITVLLALAAGAYAADKPQPRSILGYLETRDRVIVLWSGEPACYTIRTRDGKVLADKITQAEMKSRFPELAQITDSTVVAWAGM